MTISMIDHVNIVTERLEETRAFFVDVLGLTVGPRPPFAVEGYWLYVGAKPIVHMQRAPAFRSVRPRPARSTTSPSRSRPSIR
jgi:catechol 2,3-dioxygenase-like lactoylglutathione lyase family enzyme